MVSVFLLLLDSMKVFESEREREREIEFSKRVSKDFIRKLVF